MYMHKKDRREKQIRQGLHSIQVIKIKMYRSKTISSINREVKKESLALQTYAVAYLFDFINTIQFLSINLEQLLKLLSYLKCGNKILEQIQNKKLKNSNTSLKIVQIIKKNNHYFKIIVIQQLYIDPQQGSAMTSDHSINPDLATGWHQRQLIAKLRQFPLIFMNPLVDIVSKSLTSFGNSHIYRVVYMGPRHNSNIKAFKSYCSTQNAPKVHQCNSYGLKQLNKFPFKHLHEGEKFFPIRVSEYRLFTGINPTIKKQDLRFDSDFECGNLDLAIYINPVEYDLVMRVDSNTKGHTAWFYFKVSNITGGHKIKFNIINCSKKSLPYKEGMKPYVFKKSKGQWTQQGISITYHTRKLRYEGTQQANYQCLSFIYQFKDSEDVYFSYCIPYSYSYLLHRIQELRSKYPHLMKVSYQYQSTGGLQIPVLAISNFSNNTIQKCTILCSGRLHPGQTQGSWMIDGFLQQLLTPQAHFLRDRAIFKIIPMVNVDGVVLGNFRTGIMGRDLNRCFNLQDKYNEISMMRKIANELKPQIYIDFHGHSAKKNVFIYGPDYKLQDRNYLLCRLFPKLISKQTQIFRYYSCIFSIHRSKMTTGRAVMLKQFKAEYSYTVQASAYAYGPTRNQTLFTANAYQQVGAKITSSLTQFIRILRILPKRQQIKQKQETKKEQLTRKSTKNDHQRQSKSEHKNQNQRYKSSLLDIDQIQTLSILQKNLLKEILKDQAIIDQQQKQDGSEDSDYQDDTNDYSNNDLKKIFDSKFDPSTEKSVSSKKKKKENGKKLKQKNQIIAIEIDQIQVSPKKKKRMGKNKSFSNKNSDIGVFNLNNSQTIEVLQKFKSQNRSPPKVENDPLMLSSLARRKQLSRVIIQKKQVQSFQSFKSSNLIDSRNNNVQYDWSTSLMKQQQSSKHFKFQVPEYLDQTLTNKRNPTSVLQLDKKPEKKRNPLLSIKKSILPTLVRSEQNRQLDRGQKSMLSQILQQHQRKKKAQKNVRIMFL